MNERERLEGYFLMGEAVTRETMPENVLQDLLRSTISGTGGDLPAMLREAYRAGAAAALVLADDPERLAAAFRRLLDDTEGERA